MKLCTRSSHSCCFADKLKSMGRSSGFELFGRTLRLPALPRKTLLARDAAKARPEMPPREIRGLTFRTGQTIVSYSCLKCNRVVPCRHDGETMPSDLTRSAILAAAERLYAERGFSDVTLRDIVSEANVNLAAVNYHFGSKDELIAELFVSRSIALNRERLHELRAAEEKAGGAASVHD